MKYLSYLMSRAFSIFLCPSLLSVWCLVQDVLSSQNSHGILIIILKSLLLKLV